MSNNHKLEAIGFLVDEKPYCVWDWNLKQRNLDFITDLKPDYFRFMAETFAKQWEEGMSQEAALSIRALYGHALETFIAMIGATIQAPNCVPGWLLKYRQEDLESIAGKITRGSGIANRLKLEPMNWSTLSQAVMSFVQFESEDKRKWVNEGFARAWTLFASDITNEKVYVEYNNIKHGFRVRLGGFALAAGREETSGTPPSSERDANYWEQ